ncbi:peptidoglycan recognition protein family protein [Paenibacillus prosopidis]|uniref:N-acetylmuramoyl-L-alanine amidase n=1 Tax=Paenibacillus prosopidis TaxID=630520 RepID=A0A368VQM7_9BACL|nr:N-acetylmuramoyl-L-alanine amidase [Paenibacillus prosopidis]RCW44210.1 N-acetylmuramoyl-L-alanine amidase [Paenibacillus prosopidis]
MMTLKFPSNLSSDFQGVQFIDIRDQLPVNPNYTWTQLAGVRDDEVLNTLVCHHDAIPKRMTTKYSDIKLASRIATAHINSKKNHPKGDAGFPYDLWIRNGNIYWCNDIEQREYGVASNNGYTVNVCVSGDYFHGDTLTPEDRRALYVAIIILKEALPAIEKIKGHGELVPTNCPGYGMNHVREDVSALEIKLELEEELANNLQGQLLNAAALNTRVNDLYGKATAPGKFQEEAIRKLSRVADIMRSEGLL